MFCWISLKKVKHITKVRFFAIKIRGYETNHKKCKPKWPRAVVSYQWNK